jgi:hypothetical protein
VSSDRIEELKENKRIEEGIKLMKQMYGMQESLGKMPEKES